MNGIDIWSSMTVTESRTRSAAKGNAQKIIKNLTAVDSHVKMRGDSLINTRGLYVSLAGRI